MDSTTIRNLALTVGAVIVGLWLVKKLGDKTAAVIDKATKATQPAPQGA